MTADLAIALRLLYRQRFLTVGFWLAVSTAVLASMAAEFSARQPATVALDMGLSFVRLGATVFVVLLTQELIGREFERRYCLASLTYPRARIGWLLGRYSAVVVATLVQLAMMAAALIPVVYWAAGTYEQATLPDPGLKFWVTLLFVAADLAIVTAIATLLAVSASTPSFVMVGTFGFILVARSYSAIVELMTRDATFVSQFVDPVRYQSSLEALRFLFPDLGILDVRMVALYDSWSFLPVDWPVRLMSAPLYGLAVLALSGWILCRREFG